MKARVVSFIAASILALLVFYGCLFIALIFATPEMKDVGCYDELQKWKDGYNELAERMEQCGQDLARTQNELNGDKMCSSRTCPIH